MKKRVAIGTAVLAVVVAVALFVYFKFSGSSYVTYLPASSKAVACLHVDRILEESGLTEEQLRAKMPEGLSLDKTGLDFTEPVYAFVDGNGLNGVLAPVSSRSQLEETLKTYKEKLHAGSIEEQQGLSWVVLHDTYLAGFNDEAFMIVGPVLPVAQSEARQQIVSYFKQDENILEKPLYQCLQKQKGVLALAADADVLPEYYLMVQKVLGLPEHQDLGTAVQLGASLQSEAGKLVLHTEIYSEDQAMKKKLAALDNMSGQIQGEYLSQVPRNTVFWLGGNMDGNQLISFLREIPQARLALISMNQVLDANQIIQNINGDISLSVGLDPEASVMQWAGGLWPDMIFRAQMKQTDFMKDAASWVADARQAGLYDLRQVGRDQYYFRFAQMETYWGVSGKDFGAATREDVFQNMWKKEETDVLKPYKDDILESKMYLWVNMDPINKALQMLSADKEPWPFFSALEAAALRATKNNAMDIIFYTQGKENGLKQIMCAWNGLN